MQLLQIGEEATAEANYLVVRERVLLQARSCGKKDHLQRKHSKVSSSVCLFYVNRAGLYSDAITTSENSTDNTGVAGECTSETKRLYCLEFSYIH